jgi:hypothetical protein
MAAEGAQALIAMGMFFIQILICVIIGIGAWIVYQLFRPIKSISDLDEKYTTSEEVLLHKSMEKKGINLGVEILKLRELERPASIRRKIREQIIKDFYPDKEK